MKDRTRSPLEAIWRDGLAAVHPQALIGPRSPTQKLLSREESSAFLFWGKAARASIEALESWHHPELSLVISPEAGCSRSGVEWIQAEHPRPGPGSFRAGQALLEFFGALGRLRISRLEVFLSGGASSLAWLPFSSGASETAYLQRTLATLYRRRLSIAQLNRQRAELCALKSGGAAAWLKRLAPSVKCRVHLISDVAPYPVRWVGGGPFWKAQIPHRVMADNSSFVRALARASEKRGLAISHASSGGKDGRWVDCADWASHAIAESLRGDTSSIRILGGEPSLKLPRTSGRGGRQSHLAGLLAATPSIRELLKRGELELLAGASDGIDGTSGAGGVLLRADTLPGLPAVRAALRSFDTGGLFARSGAAFGSGRPSGTNVQDALLLLS